MFLKDELYLSVMELVARAYPASVVERLSDALVFPGTDALVLPGGDVQSAARVAQVVGVLLAQGRSEVEPLLWLQLMDRVTLDLVRREQDTLVDFAVKDVMLCLAAVKGFAPAQRFTLWMSRMAKIRPLRSYRWHREGSGERLHNINLYQLCGEQCRENAGLTSAQDYIDEHLALHLEFLDENGMYCDPGHPILYDFASRAHLALLLKLGYKGAFRGVLEEKLRRAADCSLLMQSATGAFPFGGRSNQFAFNEMLMAAVFEDEAFRAVGVGDWARYERFKGAARRAVEAALPWISEQRHVKNFYPRESLHGCEEYAFFDKYMITAANFAFMAFLLSAPASVGDLRSEAVCREPFFFQTSDAFHKVFAGVDGQSLEVDYRGDDRYDYTGLGRYHVQGVPEAFVLSHSFGARKDFRVASEAVPVGAAFCPGLVEADGAVVPVPDLGFSMRLVSHTVSASEVALCWEWHGGERVISESMVLSAQGLAIRLEGAAPDVVVCVPVFVTDGKRVAVLEVGEDRLVNRVEDWEICFEVPGGVFGVLPQHPVNRNGEYSLFSARGCGESWELRVFVR